MRQGARRRAVVAVGILTVSAVGLVVAFGAPEATAKTPGAVKTAGGPPSWARAVPSWVKVRPGTDPGGGTTATLSLARGECEGLQIFAAPPAKKVDARLQPLKGPGSSLKPRLYREEFVEVKTASNGEGEVGLWPDPLIPVVDAYAGERRNALPYDSTDKKPVVLYVEICAPEQQAPGTYEGAILIDAADKPKAKITIKAEVQPFALPATSSLPTTFGISIFSVAKGHGIDGMSAEAQKLLRRYAESSLLHRFSLHGMSIDPPEFKVEGDEVKIDWTAYDAEMGPLLSGTALPNGARFTTAEVRKNPWLKTEAQRQSYLRAYRQHFDEKGWTAQLFFYAKDEPKPEDVELVLQQSKEARSVPRLPVVVTAPLHPLLTPAADIVTPTINCLFKRSGPQTCPKVTSVEELRKAMGPNKQLWWYQACPAHGCDNGPFKEHDLEQAYSGWASYMVDHPVTLNRAMGTLDYLAGVDGELYYATVFAYNERDPWTQGVWDFGGNGDGTFFYPGTPAKIGGKTHVPVESLRLKHLRDGLEDYEYFKMLDALGGRDAALKAARQLVRSGYQIERDPQKWDEVRRSLTGRLSALWEKSEYARRSPVGGR